MLLSCVSPPSLMNGRAGHSPSPHALQPQSAPHVPPLDPLKPTDDTQLPHPIKQEGDMLIELLEAHEPLPGASESGSQMPEDGQDWLSEGDHELKRVKVRCAWCRPCEGCYWRGTYRYMNS